MMRNRIRNFHDVSSLQEVVWDGEAWKIAHRDQTKRYIENQKQLLSSLDSEWVGFFAGEATLESKY